MTDINIQELNESWKGVIDHEELSPIKDSYKRNVMAVLLENQNKNDMATVRKSPQDSLTYLLSEDAPTNSMGASSSTAGTGNIDIYDPILMSLVRRSYPNLMAYDVCGVQPMTMPTGLIFALKSRYSSQTGVEALFNEADTAFSASFAANSASVTDQIGNNPGSLISNNTSYTYSKAMSTANGEKLGGADGEHFNEMAFDIAKTTVEAKTRGLKGEYSHEISQDLKNVHGLDAETELANILSAEILAEINREVLRSIYTSATIGAQTGVASAGTFNLDSDADGRWSVEKFKGLVYRLDREANEIAKSTRRGKGNFIITTSDVASALNMAGYMTAPAPGTELMVDDTGNTYAGLLHGRTKVFVDPYATGSLNYVCNGYKGTSPFDAGLFYAPYIPLQMYRAVGEQSFQPRIAFKTRYGMVAHPFATTAGDGAVDPTKKNSYYRIWQVTNL